MPKDLLRILLLEDDDNDVALLLRACRKARLPVWVHAVSDGQMGIDYLSGAGAFGNRADFPFPHLIVLDLVMRPVPGIGFLRWCRASAAYAGAPIAVLTAITETREEIREALRCGADRIWVKPSYPEEWPKLATRIYEFGIAQRSGPPA